MYRRAFLIFLSLFLLVVSVVVDSTERAVSKKRGDAKCADKLHVLSSGKTFSSLFHESSNCKD